jgi:chitin deacetylase
VSLKPPGTTIGKLSSQIDAWLGGPKTSGLIILEHELDDACVEAFKANYPKIAVQGWTPVSVAQLAKSAADNATGRVYWNAENGSQGTPSALGVLDRGLATTTASSTSTNATGAPSAAAQVGAKKSSAVAQKLESLEAYPWSPLWLVVSLALLAI